MTVILVVVAIGLAALTVCYARGILPVSMDASTAENQLKAARFRSEQAAATRSIVNMDTPGQ
jgi:hypothetical protein